jgi:acetyl esterase/lipase
VLVYRTAMDWGGESLNAALDVFHPGEGGAPLPTIVWIHGGAFLSGDKGQIANYLKILAAKGYTTVGVNYSLGTPPARRSPRSLRTRSAFLLMRLPGSTARSAISCAPPSGHTGDAEARRTCRSSQSRDT